MRNDEERRGELEAEPHCAAPRTALAASALLLPLSFAIAPFSEAAAGAARLAFCWSAPGLLLLVAGWRYCAAPALTTALRAAVVSPLVLTTTTLLPALAIGLPLATASWLGAAIAAGACLAVALRPPAARVASAVEPVPESGKSELALLVVLGVFAALGVLILRLPGARLSYHGLLHAGIVAQIAAGVVPPENPALAGEPLGFYWAYHWLLAVQGALSGLSILETSPVLDVVSLVAYVGLAARVLARVLSPFEAAVGAIAGAFACSLGAGLWFAWNVAHGDAAPAGVYWPFEWLAAARGPGDPRGVTLLAKFLNVNGMPIGLACWALVLDAVLPRRARPGGGTRPTPLLALAGAAGAILFHTTTGFALYGALGPAILVAFATAGGPVRNRLREVAPGAFALVAALVLTAPYLFAVAVQSQGIHDSLIAPRGVVLYNATGVVANAWPLLVAVALGPIAWRNPVVRFAWACCVSLVALALIVQLPDNNQYKLPLVAALPCAVVYAGALVVLARRHRAMAGAIAGLVLALACASHALTVRAYLRSAMVEVRNFAGEGSLLRDLRDPDLAAAHAWLAARTPADAVVVTEPVSFGTPPAAAGSGRREFVLDGGHHTEGHPAYRPRRALVRRLLHGSGSAAPIAAELELALPRPLFVLVGPDQDPATRARVAARLEAAPGSFERVFESGDVAVFRVRTATERR